MSRFFCYFYFSVLVVCDGKRNINVIHYYYHYYYEVVADRISDISDIFRSSRRDDLSDWVELSVRPSVSSVNNLHFFALFSEQRNFAQRTETFSECIREDL